MLTITKISNSFTDNHAITKAVKKSKKPSVPTQLSPTKIQQQFIHKMQLMKTLLKTSIIK